MLTTLLGPYSQGRAILLAALDTLTHYLRNALADRPAGSSSSAQSRPSEDADADAVWQQLAGMARKGAAVLPDKKQVEDSQRLLQQLERVFLHAHFDDHWQLRLALCRSAHDLLRTVLPEALCFVQRLALGACDGHPEVAALASAALRSIPAAHLAALRPKLQAYLQDLVTALPRVMRGTLEDAARAQLIRVALAHLRLLGGAAVHALLASDPHRFAAMLGAIYEINLPDTQSACKFSKQKRLVPTLGGPKCHQEAARFGQVLAGASNFLILLDFFIPQLGLSVHAISMGRALAAILRHCPQPSLAILDRVLQATLLHSEQPVNSTAVSGLSEFEREVLDTVHLEILQSLFLAFGDAASNHHSNEGSEAEEDHHSDPSASMSLIPSSLAFPSSLSLFTPSSFSSSSSAPQSPTLVDSPAPLPILPPRWQASPLAVVQNQLIQKTLYPLVEALGSPSELISIAAEKALRALSVASGHPKMPLHQLILQNADYLMDAISFRMRYLSDYPHTPRLLSSFARHVGMEALPLLRDVLDLLLNSIDDLFATAPLSIHRTSAHQLQRDTICINLLRVIHATIEMIHTSTPPSTISSTSSSSSSSSSSPSSSFSRPNASILATLTQRSDREPHRTTDIEEIRQFFEAHHQQKAEEEALGDTTEPNAEDESGAPVSPYEELVLSILAKLANLVSIPSKPITHLVAQILAQGISTLARLGTRDQKLLPTVHTLWSPLLCRLKSSLKREEVSSVQLIFHVIETIALHCREFLASKFVKDLWPLCVTVLGREAKRNLTLDMAGYQAIQSTAYLFSDSFKIQSSLLKTLAALIGEGQQQLYAVDVFDTFRALSLIHI